MLNGRGFISEEEACPIPPLPPASVYHHILCLGKRGYNGVKVQSHSYRTMVNARKFTYTPVYNLKQCW
jgi:hypothetical protein